MTIRDHIFNVTLHSNHPIIRDKSSFALQEVKNEYRGKCFKGVFIKEIIGILDFSDSTLTTTEDQQISCYMSVKFNAKVVEYKIGDIFPGVTVCQNDRRMIFGTHEDVTIVVRDITHNGKSVFNSIRIGQKIPCCVVAHDYPPKSEFFTICVVPLGVERDEFVYELSSNLTSNDIKRLKPLVDSINTSIESQKNNTRFDTFRSLFGDNTRKRTQNILEFMKQKDIKGKIIGKVHDVSNASLDIMVEDKYPNMVIRETAIMAFTNILGTINDTLHTVNEMNDIYSDEDIRSHKNIWEMIKILWSKDSSSMN
jgi:hypothetical protein